MFFALKLYSSLGSGSCSCNDNIMVYIFLLLRFVKQHISHLAPLSLLSMCLTVRHLVQKTPP